MSNECACNPCQCGPTCNCGTTGCQCGPSCDCGSQCACAVEAPACDCAE